MAKFILGKKIGMTQIFDKKGEVIPVTIIKAGKCEILQIKTKEKDGYKSIQIGFEKIKKEKKIKKPLREKPFRYIKEFSAPKGRDLAKGGKDEIKDYKVGEVIDTSVFKEGDVVKISGISKGKGFAGAVKRWGFSGRGKTHGVKHEARTVGSVGTTGPERVIKGKKMPGRMGGKRVTIKNLKVVKVEPENDLLIVKGAIPGRKGTLLEIRG